MSDEQFIFKKTHSKVWAQRLKSSATETFLAFLNCGNADISAGCVRTVGREIRRKPEMSSKTFSS